MNRSFFINVATASKISHDLFLNNPDGEVFIYTTLAKEIQSRNQKLSKSSKKELRIFNDSSIQTRDLNVLIQLMEIVKTGDLNSNDKNQKAIMPEVQHCSNQVKQIVASVKEFYHFYHRLFKENKIKKDKEIYTVFINIEAIKQIIQLKIDMLKSEIQDAKKSWFYKIITDTERKEDKKAGLEQLLVYFQGANCSDKTAYEVALTQVKQDHSQFDKGNFSDIANILYGIEKYYEFQEMKENSYTIISSDGIEMKDMLP